MGNAELEIEAEGEGRWSVPVSATCFLLSSASVSPIEFELSSSMSSPENEKLNAGIFDFSWRRVGMGKEERLHVSKVKDSRVQLE